MNAEEPASGDMRPPLLGLAKLMRLAMAGVDLSTIGMQLRDRAASNPQDVNALLDLSTVLQLSSHPDMAMTVQHMALMLQQHYHQGPEPANAAIRLLAFAAPGRIMDNTPLDCLLEDSDISLETLYVGPDIPVPEQLPEHDVVFVCVGETDANQQILQQLAETLEHWPRPVINRPEHIARLSRDQVVAALASAPGTLIPGVARISRLRLQGLACGAIGLEQFLPGQRFPVIVRPVGSHAGHGLEKIDDSLALKAYLEVNADTEFYISPWIDYRSSDGQFRKYRVVMIDGEPFLCHLAISDAWMVHYLNAGMTDSADKRAEEAQAMASFAKGFACQHREALAYINDRMGLEYLGIDCAQTQDGRLLVFELDSAMIVHAMDPVDQFDYKQPAMKEVFSAFRSMLMRTIHSAQR